jgi:hypothetical protein
VFDSIAGLDGVVDAAPVVAAAGELLGVDEDGDFDELHAVSVSAIAQREAAARPAVDFRISCPTS